MSAERERRKGEVKKGPRTGTCSATYGFTPETEIYMQNQAADKNCSPHLGSIISRDF